jgi:hypothetical protein
MAADTEEVCFLKPMMRSLSMKRWLWLWLLIVVVVLPVLSAGLSAEAQQGESIGRVTMLEGRATVRRDGSSTPQPLRVQSPVYQQDAIRTGAASKLQVTFVDDTVVNLGEKSTLEITRFVYSPQQQTQTSLLTIPAGVFRAIAKKLLPQSAFEVTTPTAIAAIRGTDFMGEVTPETSSFVVLEGSVALFSIRTILHGIVALTEGLGSTISRDQLPSTPNKWGEARIEALRRATTIR